MTTRITVDRVKVCKFASEETLCFEARVLLDGIVIARAHNDGHGGCTTVFPISTDTTIRARCAEAEKIVEAMPAEVTEFKNDDGSAFEYKPGFGDYIDKLVNDAQLEKDLRSSFNRAIKAKVLFVANGELRGSKGKISLANWQATIQHFQKKYPGAQILNTMPAEAAFKVYRDHAAQS